MSKQSKTTNPLYDTIAADISGKYLTTPYDITASPFELMATLRYDPTLYSGPLPLLEAIDEKPLSSSFFFLLKYHVDKFHRSGFFFAFPVESLTMDLLLVHLTNALQSYDRLTAHKIRVLVSKEGGFKIEPTPLPVENVVTTRIPNFSKNIGLNLNSNDDVLLDLTSPSESDWVVFLDQEPLIPNPFTSFKTTKRDAYNAARERFGIEPGAHTEVILQNGSGNLMEGSIASVAFWRKLTHPTSGEVTYSWVTPHLAIGCMDGAVRKWLIDSNQLVENKMSASELKNGEPVLIMNGVLGAKVGRLVLNN